jgi:hypothetical protein
MASIGFLLSGVSTCSALCASLAASGLPLPSGGSCSSGRPGALVSLFGGDQPEQHRLRRSGFFELSGGRPSTLPGTRKAWRMACSWAASSGNISAGDAASQMGGDQAR